MKTIQILAISGSVRARSTNTELLRAAGLVAPDCARVTLFAGLMALPHFNPDLDMEGAVPPATVADFRRVVAEADAMLFCSPEYAHGVPGVLKDALDWLVSGSEIVFKPIGVLSASPESIHARASLVETLTTMSTTVVPNASLEFALRGNRLDGEALAELREVREPLQAAIAALIDAVRSR